MSKDPIPEADRPTPDPVSRLAWLTVQDSAFPAGRFAQVRGLDSWLAAHPDEGEAGIAALAQGWLSGSVATLDAVFLAHAWRAPDQAVALDILLRERKVPTGLRDASEGTGRQLALMCTQVIPDADRGTYLTRVITGAAPGNLAVVEAVVRRELGIGLVDAVLGHLHSALSGLLVSVVHRGRLAPPAAQRLLLRNSRMITELARRALLTDLPEARSSMPELETYTLWHERFESRPFPND